MEPAFPTLDDLEGASRARHQVDILSHLDGALDEHTLDAMQGVWAMLEHAAADASSHARAVRARMFWESLAPQGAAAAPVRVVSDLQPSWAEEATAELAASAALEEPESEAEDVEDDSAEPEEPLATIGLGEVLSDDEDAAPVATEVDAHASPDDEERLAA